MTRRDPYAVLGIARDADGDAIRRRYRQLARELHPDVNPGDPVAEERFKQVSEAFAILGDPDRRRAYDEFGEVALDGGFDAEAARAARDRFRAARRGEPRWHPPDPFFDEGDGGSFGAGPEHWFGELFSGAASRRAGRGADLEARIELDFLDAVRGGERVLELERRDSRGRVRRQAVTVRFPPGVADGDRLRVPGRGEAGAGPALAGDLWVRVRVRPHPVFERVGRDLVFDLPVTVREAILGAEVEVPTPDGRAIVRVPPGTQSGTRLRLRGKGVPQPGGPPGDLLARVQIRVPERLDAEAREAVRKLERCEDPALRERLFRKGS